MAEALSKDEFLTVDQIAGTLQMNPQTIRNMIDRGELPAVRIGSRRVRVLRSDLDNFLTDRRRLTKRSKKRVAFDDAIGNANKALRDKSPSAAVRALRLLSHATVELADEIEHS